MKAYEALLKAISKLVEFVTCALLTALVLIITWQVFSRYVLGTTPSWSEEISVILVVWFGMLGAGLGVRDGSHLAVEFIVRGMSAGPRMFFHRLSFALIIAFSGLMVIGGFRLVKFVMDNNEINPATGIPVGYTYLALPLAGIFIFMHALKHLLDLFAGREPAVEDLFAETGKGADAE